jgi:hypothetical protein
LLPEQSDKWWELNGATDPQLLTQEISDLVTINAIPYINKYLEPGALPSLWELGQSPGLTQVQRGRFLSKLREKSG